MKLVIVEWQDSCQPVASWHYLSDPPSNEIIHCLSVGWVISENEAVLMLSPNLGDYENENGAQGSGFIRIPKISITDIREINHKRKRRQKCAEQ